MEIRLKPETESRLNDLVSKRGRSAGDLVQDAMAAYLIEATSAPPTLDETRRRLSSRQPVRPHPAPADAVRAERESRGSSSAPHSLTPQNNLNLGVKF